MGCDANRRRPAATENSDEVTASATEPDGARQGETDFESRWDGGSAFRLMQTPGSALILPTNVAILYDPERHSTTRKSPKSLFYALFRYAAILRDTRVIEFSDLCSTN